MDLHQTICALSTPAGTGGIAVIRVSGPEAFPICQRLLGKGGRQLKDLPSHRAVYRNICDPEEDELLDQGLVLPMKGPGTFTGEDTVEIDCHGGMYLCRRILSALIGAGCRMAQPGEFTRRAFLNGKIDLTGAEAVMDMIDAGTSWSLKAASSGLQGKLYQSADRIREEILETLMKIEVNIDYPEYDDLPEITDGQIEETADRLMKETEALLKTADSGILLREGLKTAIIGEPNVGKSSLLNQLLREERAIVTDIPGTTRDVLSETADLGGIPVRLLDTAGIRETGDIVEQLGVERSKKAIAESDLVLLLVDGTAAGRPIPFLPLIQGKPYLLLVNKEDLVEDLDDVLRELSEQTASLEGSRPLGILPISAKTGEGIEQIKEKIKEAFFSGTARMLDGPMVTNLRQKEALIRAREALSRVIAGAGMPQDLLAIDLNEAADALGDLTGKSARDDVIDRIFERFCLGK